MQAVTRPGQPNIKVQQADGRAIQLTSVTANPTFSLTLIEDSGQADVTDLVPVLSPLTRKDGAPGPQPDRQVELGDPLPLMRNDQLALKLTATLPEQTEYTGILTLRYATRSERYTVSVTRAAFPAFTIPGVSDGKVSLDVHFISSLPVILRSACKAWGDREPV